MKNVIVNGMGAVGKRVANAVEKQDDMNLYGVADVAPTVSLKANLTGPLKGTDLYVSVPEKSEELEDAGFDVKDDLPTVLENDEVDIVVDATPKGVDKKNKSLYEKTNTKAIFQGGADTSLAEVCFNSFANYEEAKGEDFVKVVSCNTTSLSRLMYALDGEYGVDKAIASLVRRAGDPPQDSRGPVNSIVPVPHIPSHHGPDLQEVMPHIDITTMAVKVPTTLSHLHMINLKVEEDVEREEVIDTLKGTPRIRLFSSEEGYSSTAKIIENFRDKRLRSDMPEVAVWEETIDVEDNRIYLINQVHQESIIAPENIDAIRSMLKMDDKWSSIEKTNNKMGLK